MQNIVILSQQLVPVNLKFAKIKWQSLDTSLTVNDLASDSLALRHDLTRNLIDALSGSEFIAQFAQQVVSSVIGNSTPIYEVNGENGKIKALSYQCTSQEQESILRAYHIHKAALIEDMHTAYFKVLHNGKLWSK